MRNISRQKNARCSFVMILLHTPADKKIFHITTKNISDNNPGAMSHVSLLKSLIRTFLRLGHWQSHSCKSGHLEQMWTKVKSINEKECIYLQVAANLLTVWRESKECLVMSKHVIEGVAKVISTLLDLQLSLLLV